MNIVILGAGQVGSELSAILASDHDVTLIDLKQEKLQKISDHHDLKTICGNACYPKTLEQAEIETADLAIAMTQYDEVNMVACQMIKHMSKKTKTMARIRATQYLGGKGSEIFEAGDYTIDVVISPENLITDFIKRLIEVPGANKVLDFGNGQASMVSVKAKGGLITGHKISELKDLIPNVDVRVAAINRDENLLIPKGEDTIDKGDEVYFISAKSNIKKIISTIYQSDKSYKNIMIAGGGRIGRRLANSLESKYRVKIIEADKDRCIYLNEKLGNSLILHGDSSDSELLEEENIENMDLFCALTNNDEANVMSSLLAKKLGAKKIVSLVNKQNYLDLIKENEEVDITIAPTDIAIGVVLKNLSKKELVTAHSLKRGQAEAIEIVAKTSDNPENIVGKEIGDIITPEGTTIAAVFDNKNIKIAHHDLKVQENDHLIVFLSDSSKFEEVERRLTK